MTQLPGSVKNLIVCLSVCLQRRCLITLVHDDHVDNNFKEIVAYLYYGRL